ncbi:hypothetical protein J6590_074353 [Homalodisca vitripennis]|nr:hypothetical protein J6590_074353 [Homalodisca vitripennis]
MWGVAYDRFHYDCGLLELERVATGSSSASTAGDSQVVVSVLYGQSHTASTHRESLLHLIMFTFADFGLVSRSPIGEQTRGLASKVPITFP